jgi:RimJ/RimL family protein N-acetyltransferase
LNGRFNNYLMIPENLELETSRVLLRPMKASDYDSFLPLTQDEDAWAYFTLNLKDPDQLLQWVNVAMEERKAGLRRPFTIIDKRSGQVAGSSSLGNISFHDLRLEIGWTWLGASFRGSGVNLHAKFAQLSYVFDILGFERVELKTDVLNQRSRAGIRKIGAVEEGVLRSHMAMWNNRRRDSVYYSILKSEWPELKQTIFRGVAHETN